MMHPRMFKTRVVLYITGASLVIIIALGGYTYYLKEVLSNTQGDLKDAVAQISFLQEQKEKADAALARQVVEAGVIRRDLADALQRAKEDEEFQVWAPNKLPQIIIDDFRAPK